MSTGVAFPADGDQRPTTPVVKGILADAVRGVDPDLAGRIDETSGWRTAYVELVAQVTAASAASGHAATRIAADGLGSMRNRLVYVDDSGTEVPLAHAALDRPEGILGVESVRGTADPVTELVVTYGGAELRGEELREQAWSWVNRGIVEPSFASAIGEVIDHPEWLRLPDRQVVLVGAGAEMGPMDALLSWGADVLAIDLPRSKAWTYKKAAAVRGAGTLTFPVGEDGASGADLVRQPAAVLDFIRRAGDGRPLVLGMHAYADGGSHVQLTAAADLLATAITSDDPDTALAWLATPTDAFVVSPEIVEAATRQWEHRGPLRAALQKPAQLATRGRIFAPAYRSGTPTSRGIAGGIADVLIPQQGPNYAMAKRLQRWRGIAAQDAGQSVSFNVAPAAWTRSVVKNPVLASAYSGAKLFGIEVFEPDTCRTLMAALLVHDLMTVPPPRRHPEDLFSDQAAHGGLWRAAYEPKTVLGVAALAGMPRTLARRVRPRGRA